MPETRSIAITTSTHSIRSTAARLDHRSAGDVRGIGDGAGDFLLQQLAEFPAQPVNEQPCGAFGRAELPGEFAAARAFIRPPNPIRSSRFPMLYHRLADTVGCAFLNTQNHVHPSRMDGLHFDAASHLALRRAIAAALAKLDG